MDAFETRPALRDDLRAPTPTPNEVLVRVHASSVTPADNSIAAGLLKQMGVEYEFPVILGRDYFGVIEDVGADVTGYSHRAIDYRQATRAQAAPAIRNVPRASQFSEPARACERVRRSSDQLFDEERVDE